MATSFDSGYVWTTAMYLNVSTRLRFSGTATRTSATNVRVDGVLEVYQGSSWNTNAIYSAVNYRTEWLRVKPSSSSGGTWTKSISYNVTISGSGSGSFTDTAYFCVYNNAESGQVGNWSPAVNATISYGTWGDPPSGISVKWNSHTWNSVNITTSVTSWGSNYNAGSTGTQQIICVSGATASDWTTKGRICKSLSVTPPALSGTQSVGNSNADTSLDGGITVKGCTAYKIAGWAWNSNGNAGTAGFDNTTRYTPPAPLTTLSKSENPSEVGNNVVHTITIVGGNSTNNNDVTVTTQYRYSTDGGSNYSAWTSAGTGKPWDTKTAQFNSHYGASIKVEARQVYQSQNSEVKKLSYTANQGTSPGNPVVTNFTPLVNGARATVTTSSYGHPSSIDGRYVELGIGPANGGNLWHHSGVANVLSATITTTEASSVYPSGSLPINPNTQYAYRALASNQVIWNFGSWVNFITLPATPSACSLTVTGTTTATLSITSPTQGNAATMTAYYKLNSGSWTSAGTITSGGTITKNLTGLTAGTAYTATVKITNSSGDSGTLASSSVTTYKAPNTPTVTNFVPLVNGGKATVSVSSYGVPASANGRYIELEVGPAGGGTPYRYFTVGNTSSQNNITVNNSSAVYPSGGHITIAANTKYAYRGYASNTQLTSVSSWVDFITLPAAPTATSSAINSVSGSLTITAPSQGTAATLTAYYKVGSGNYISAGTITPGASKTVTVTGLDPSTAYTITVKLTNSSGDSATATTSFTTGKPLYCSVSGKAKIVRNLYCSVNGQTKEIKKLYGAVRTKNLFSLDLTNVVAQSGISITSQDSNSISIEALSNASAYASARGSINLSDMGLSVGDTVTVSLKMNGTYSGNNGMALRIDKNNSGQPADIIKTLKTDSTTQSFVIPDGTTKLGIYFYTAYGSAPAEGATATFYEIQFESGSTATTYIPYTATKRIW